MHFLIQFLGKHDSFRIPELEAICILENIRISFDKPNTTSPFLQVEMDSISDCKKLLNRSILIKNIIELWAAEETLEKVNCSLKKKETCLIAKFNQSSFKFLVSAFGKSLALPVQITRMKYFEWLVSSFSKVDLVNPSMVLCYFEYYIGGNIKSELSKAEKENPVICYFGVLVGEGNGCHVVNQYDLKKRSYVGTTSMDAELSLISANQALAKPGMLIYDPFVGTGSFMIACEHFGAYAIGSDIDGRKQRRINENLQQYGLFNLSLGTFAADMAHNPWRNQALFDAIVCDPPYGVREGAKKIASTDKSPFKKNGELRYPTMEPYELADIAVDLLVFALGHLVLGGRLVFWSVEEDIPLHPAMRLISKSEQNFGKWSRYLITLEKLYKVEDPFLDLQPVKHSEKRFRELYFSKHCQR